MHTDRIKSDSEASTIALARKLADELHGRATRPAFVQLSGTLGAGKTTFSKAFIGRWLELDKTTPIPNITSPTFNIVRTYGATDRVVHMDFYRLKSFDELEAIGVENYFHDSDCCLVEWLEQIPQALAMRPEGVVLVQIEIDDPVASPNLRTISVSR